jgi:lysophospholipase L1-like esterase
LWSGGGERCRVLALLLHYLRRSTLIVYGQFDGEDGEFVRKRWQTWLLRFALFAVSPVLIFGVLELTALGLGIEPLVESKNFQDRSNIRTCRWNPADIPWRCDPEKRSRYLTANPQRKGVFVYGGSSVAPANQPKKITFFLQKQLREERPDQYKVWNLGLSCKDSIYVRSCVETSVEAQPNFLVIYSGHNDFSGFRSRFPELLILAEKYGWWLAELENLLARTRGYSLFAATRSAPIRNASDPGASLSSTDLKRANEVILDAYTENLSAVIELARERRQQVVLVTIIGNLYEFPTKRHGWDEVVSRARAAGGEADPWLASYAAGISSFRAGNFVGAQEHFKVARDADPQTRAPGILNPRIRELAAAHSHVHLVDFERELDRLGLEEGIGCTFFDHMGNCDGVHPNTRTNELIGTAVARKLIEIDEAT